MEEKWSGQERIPGASASGKKASAEEPPEVRINEERRKQREKHARIERALSREEGGCV